jgi:acyl carrier protein
MEPSPAGDVCCPACGKLLWWFRDRMNANLKLRDSLRYEAADSLAFVELVMELEEEYGVRLSEIAVEDIHTIEDAIRALRKERKG